MPAKNSTIDRIIPRAMRSLGRVAPLWQASLAAKLFLRTPPRRTPRSKDAVPAGQVRTFARGTVVGEVWEPKAPQAPVGTVLLLHGWGGRRTQLYPFVPGLLAANYRVVTFDAPGHGDSRGSWLSLILFARTIRKVASELGPLSAVIAHSFGGPAAAIAIRDGLAVDRLVTIGAPADPTAWFSQFCAYLGFDADATKRARTAIEADVGESMDGLAIERFGDALRLPMLVIHDRLDGEVDYSAAARIVAAAPGARLMTTEGLGHRRILKHDDVIAQAIEFVASPTVTIPAPRPSAQCRHCGNPTVTARDAWEPRLCMSCGVEAMLQRPADRWTTAG